MNSIDNIIYKKLQEKQRLFLNKKIGFKRKSFEMAIKNLEMPNVNLIAIRGLCGTGKTTLLRQIYENLLENVSPENIIYFSFDEYITRNIKFLARLLELIVPMERRTYFYVLLDEIQYVKNWQGVIKEYVDFYPNVKIIASESSAVFTKNKIDESLTQRNHEIHVEKLSFNEFVNISKLTEFKLEEVFNLKQFLLNPDSKTFQKIQKKWALIKRKALLVFLKYQFYGQFPEALEYGEIQDKYRYINEGIYKKLTEEDLPLLCEVENVLEFNRLYQILVESSDSYLEIINLSRELGISQNTLKRYLNILENSYLLGDHLSFHESLRKRSRAKQKKYIISTNFYAARNNLSSNFAEPQVLENLLKTSFYWELKKSFAFNFFFYKDKKKIDFLCTDDPLFKKMIPIEVKYKSVITKNDFKIMESYLNKNRIENGFIFALSTGKIDLGKKRTLWLLPAPLFL